MHLQTMLAVVMLVFGGMYTGIVLAFAVERTHLWSRMPIAQYAVDFRRSLYRVDPLQPILASVAMLAAAWFAWLADGPARMWAIAALALLTVIFVATLVVAEPINRKFRKRPEGEAPEHAGALRDRWRRFHWARTVAAIAALIALACAATV